MAASLQEKLLGLGAERLAILLAEHASHDKILNKKLKLALIALSPEKLAKTLRSQISQLKKSDRFIDWQQATKFAKELQLLCDSLENDLLSLSPTLAAELAEEFLAIAPKLLERVDDSYGSMGDIFMQAVKIWGKAYLSIDYEPEALAAKLLCLTLKDEYGVYSYLIEAFLPALQKKGLAQLAAQVIASLSNSTQIYYRMRLLSILHTIADANHSPDDYIKAFEITGCPITDEACLNIAKRLNSIWRSKEALQWLDKIHSQSRHFNQYMDLKIEAYDLEGESQQAQALRWQAFTQTLSMNYYQAYLKAAPMEQHVNIQREALSVACSYKDVLQALHWLLEAGYMSEAASNVRCHINKLNGSAYHMLRPMAKQFADNGYFLEAVLLYSCLCEPVLTSARSKYYPYAAKDLKQAMELSQHIKEWEVFSTGADYLQALKKQHARKYGFWQTYEAL